VAPNSANPHIKRFVVPLLICLLSFTCFREFVILSSNSEVFYLTDIQFYTIIENLKLLTPTNHIGWSL